MTTEVKDALCKLPLDAQVFANWHGDFGRMGDLFAAFLSTPRLLLSAEGKVAYFGEVLGKHSDISYTIDLADFSFSEITNDDVAVLAKYEMTDVGLNPLESIQEEEEEEDDSDDDADEDELEDR